MDAEVGRKEFYQDICVLRDDSWLFAVRDELPLLFYMQMFKDNTSKVSRITPNSSEEPLIKGD